MEWNFERYRKEDASMSSSNSGSGLKAGPMQLANVSMTFWRSSLQCRPHQQVQNA